MVNSGLYSKSGSYNVTPTDTSTDVLVSNTQSGTAIPSVSMPAVPGATNYVTGLWISLQGTSGSATSLQATLGGLLGSTTMYILVPVPTGTANCTNIYIPFNRPLPASGQNTAITLTLNATVTGSPGQNVSLQGFYI